MEHAAERADAARAKAVCLKVESLKRRERVVLEPRKLRHALVVIFLALFSSTTSCRRR